MMEFYANLHTHSTHSDGKYDPYTLAKIAKDEGYKAIAVTDHDTATGYVEMKKACDELGLETIFGVEFSAPCSSLKTAEGNDEVFHLVAFHFDPNEPEMKQYLYEMARRETDQTQTLFERGLADGLIKGITWQEVLDYNKGIAWLCNEHVFFAMLDKGLVTERDYPWFFDNVYGARRDEVPPSFPFKEPEEIIPLVHKAGGMVLVAHPHKQLQHIDALMAMGIDGMEVWHPDLTEEEKVEAYKIALEKNLFISGGSDHSGLCGGEYSGYEKDTDCPYYIEPLSVGVPKQYFDELKNRKLNR